VSPRVPESSGGSGLLSSTRWIADIFDRFIDSIEIGVYVLDRTGVILKINKFALERNEWEEYEVVGRNVFDVMPDLSETGLEEKLRQIIRERKIMVLADLERTDHLGRDLVYNLIGIPIIEEEEVMGVLAVTNDITEKRALESQVAEAKEYLQSLIDNASDMIYTVDREGYITFLNKMGREVTGYAFGPEEKEHYTKYIVEKDLEKAQTLFRKSLEGEPQRHATSIIASDGRQIDFLINTTPIRKDQEIVGVLGIARDITERKQMQAQLLQASKMAAIGELASGVAHEINNPVGIISGIAEQLEFLIARHRDHPEEVTEKLLEHAEMIREQADRCRRITQGLLNFARGTEIRYSGVDVAGLIRETIKLVKNRAIGEGKKVETHFLGELPSLTADPHLLEQVFLNLVNNALDAVEKNGTVTISARAADETVIIDVADNGVGIPEEDQERIFDPFFTTKPVGKGTGLGLSICFGIVERMNGEVSVRSKLGHGTTLSVRLPLKPNYNAEK
jgi:PAS domain S-box-containing protein